MKITKQNFGKTDSGQAVDIYTLTNNCDMEVKITNYGGIVTSLVVPDRDRKKQDVVLGYESLEKYLADSPYFGALIGRFGNRIAKGKFTLNGKEYTLAQNNADNHLHGGIKGFDKVLWQARPIESQDSAGLQLQYLSKDGEEGYPGNLECTVIYSITNDNELSIDYKAITDAPTIVNLTHHSYFNLAGHGSGDILGHEMMINADAYTPVNEDLIPTGKIEPVEGSAMDFRRPHTIGERIDQVPGGYDHNYVLNKKDGRLELAARVTEPTTGRIMEVFTTEPGMQFYSGNFLDDSLKGKGAIYQKRAGFCLETQHFPDSPNQPSFPSVVLNPGQMYRHLTVYKFSAE